MKLFVFNSNNEKVYLNLVASTRQQLANLIGSHNFYLSQVLYSVNDVYAETDMNSTAAGAIVGGLIGALGGPPGIAIGGILGGIIGNGSNQEETEKAKRFNNS